MAVADFQAKLKKSLARFKERIENGSYYEAQQTMRAIINRYVNSKNFDAAIELLYQSTMILMEFKRFDEASDLLLYMVEIFEAEQKPSEKFQKQHLPKLIELMNFLPDDDANLPNLAKELTKFSAKQAANETGFPSLNFVLGEKLYYSGSPDLVNTSESYLLLSGENPAAFKLLVELAFGSYLRDSDVDSFGSYLARLVIPYLVLGNVEYARKSCVELISKVKESKRAANFNFVESGSIQVLEPTAGSEQLVDCYGLVNFLQLLVELAQRNSPENASNFKLLVGRYKGVLERAGLTSKVNSFGEVYFGVSIVQKSNNMLQEMMSGLLGGGSS